MMMMMTIIIIIIVIEDTYISDGPVDSRSFSWMPADDAADGPPLQLVYVELLSSSLSSS